MGHLGAKDFEGRHEIIKSQQDLIQKGLYGGLPEEDLFKSQGEGSKGGKIIGHTKSGKPIYDANSHQSHMSFTKQDHIDAKNAHIAKIEEHHNAYWKAKTNEKMKEHEDATNYHKYQGMSHHNDAVNHDKNILGKTKSGKEVHVARHPRDYKDFTSGEHKEAAKFHSEKGDSYLATQHENQAKHKEGLENEEKDKNVKTHELKPLSEKPLSSQLSAITGDGWNDEDYENADGSGGSASAAPGNVIRHKKTRDLFKIPEKEPVKSEDDLKVKVGTGTFQGKDNWRVTSSNGEIGVYPKDKYSEEEAKKHYTEKFSKKPDVKKSDDSDISKAFEVLGVSISNDIEKAEGSKGGVVIGHTSSGKPIYDSFNHPSHENFTAKDHHEAFEKHHSKVQLYRSNHKDKAKKHSDESEKHSKEAWKKDSTGNFMSKDKVEKSEDNDIEKGGAGSGRKIGVTGSGKDIYDKFNHEKHKDFTDQDHKDASELTKRHSEIYDSESKNEDNHSESDKRYRAGRSVDMSKQSEKHIKASNKK